MRIRLVRLLVPVSLAVMACGRDASSSAGMSEDLKKDLEASSSKFELAGADNARPMAYVSELEQSNGAAPVERSTAWAAAPWGRTGRSCSAVDVDRCPKHLALLRDRRSLPRYHVQS